MKKCKGKVIFRVKIYGLFIGGEFWIVKTVAFKQYSLQRSLSISLRVT